jgi:ATP/maltotriose-dependent transcriptional regulator MalT
VDSTTPNPDILSTPDRLDASWGFHLVTVAAHASGSPLRRRSYATQTFAGRPARIHVSSIQIRSPEDAPACFMFGFTSEPLETKTETAPTAELGLRPREWEIASLMMSGLDTNGISRELGISQATTRTHIRNILQTLGVHSRVQALTRIGSLYGDPSPR